MTRLFRLALVLVMVALCAPARYASQWDGQWVSPDEDAVWASNAILDDDGTADSIRVLADSPWAEREPSTSLVGRGARASLAPMGAAQGLRAAPGVIGVLFRPPRV